jgi:hypothetical protein
MGGGVEAKFPEMMPKIEGYNQARHPASLKTQIFCSEVHKTSRNRHNKARRSHNSHKSVRSRQQGQVLGLVVDAEFA